jgi:hypothetical protein
MGPFGTLRGALWIGEGQWAGKSTVARILALRYGLTAYHYDRFTGVAAATDSTGTRDWA